MGTFPDGDFVSISHLKIDQVFIDLLQQVKFDLKYRVIFPISSQRIQMPGTGILVKLVRNDSWKNN